MMVLWENHEPNVFLRSSLQNTVLLRESSFFALKSTQSQFGKKVDENYDGHIYDESLAKKLSMIFWESKT